MDEQNKKHKFSIVHLLIVGLCTALVFFFIGYIVGEEQMQKEQIKRNFYNSGFETTKMEPTTTKATTTVPTTTPPTTTEKALTLLYEDDKVKVWFDKVSGYSRKEISFIVENKTEQTLTFQEEAISLDEISIPSANCIMSDEVAAQSKGLIKIRVSDFDVPSDPKKITGDLVVIDFGNDTNTRSYHIKFTNVNIK